MILDVDAALGYLGELDPTGAGGLPQGAPAHELTRSPAAARTGSLAAAEGLFLAHFEHRAPPLPAEEELAWEAGVLPEDKYGVFRHELPIGSFHPHHRAKWAAHELCHALIGFAWQPSASPLALATAGRLAELVPVVLWYFLDEIRLRRCPQHREPLFRTFCAACEQAAREGPAPLDGARAAQALHDAERFLDRELAAVAQTRRLGRPVHHCWGSLDLASDGLAYAASDGPRLVTEAFHLWAERFFTPPVGGGHASLESLEARAVEVARGIAEGREIGSMAPSAQAGRDRWVAMDLAARLLEVRAVAPAGLRAELLGLVDDLADGATADRIGQAYAALAGAGLPPAADVFAVGYPVEGLPCRSVARIADGLASVVPTTLEVFEDAGLDPVPAFLAADEPARVALGDRFAAWLAREAPGPVADVARFEAMLRSAGSDPQAQVLGPVGEGWRVAAGARVERFSSDPVELAERIAAGEVEGRAEGERIGLSAVVPEAPTVLIAALDAAGELVLVDVPDELGGVLLDDPAGLPPDVLEELAGLGLVVRTRWSLG